MVELWYTGAIKSLLGQIGKKLWPKMWFRGLLGSRSGENRAVKPSRNPINSEKMVDMCSHTHRVEHNLKQAPHHYLSIPNIDPYWLLAELQIWPAPVVTGALRTGSKVLFRGSKTKMWACLNMTYAFYSQYQARGRLLKLSLPWEAELIYLHRSIDFYCFWSFFTVLGAPSAILDWPAAG